MFIDKNLNIAAPVALALGNFDGLHLGHMAVISAVVNNPGGYLPAVASFSPHPKELLAGKAPDLIITGEQRERLLKEAGVKRQVVFDFACVKDMSPREFLDRLLSALPVKMLAAGYNFRFGKDGAGDIIFLKSYCEEKGIDFFAAERMEIDGVTVSSTAIREYISSGEIDKASAMLGRPPEYSITVSDGDHRGRTIGFPTINQELPRCLVSPKFGVYVSSVLVDGVWKKGITNIGIRPTYRVEHPLFETFIIGFEGDLYGREITLRLHKFIRPETKFSSLDELKNAIENDLRTAVGTNI